MSTPNTAASACNTGSVRSAPRSALAANSDALVTSSVLAPSSMARSASSSVLGPSSVQKELNRASDILYDAVVEAL